LRKFPQLGYYLTHSASQASGFAWATNFSPGAAPLKVWRRVNCVDAPLGEDDEFTFIDAQRFTNA
jgi:hypothetical protein